MYQEEKKSLELEEKREKVIAPAPIRLVCSGIPSVTASHASTIDYS